eukprot:1147880-Rhodomonas_salina.1
MPLSVLGGRVGASCYRHRGPSSVHARAGGTGTPLSAYARPRRCPVLTPRMVLPGVLHFHGHCQQRLAVSHEFDFRSSPQNISTLFCSRLKYFWRGVSECRVGTYPDREHLG